MKKIFILILTTVSALILAGCDDMLDRVPKDKLSPETYFKTAKECELFTNEFYLIFPGASSIFYEEADVIVPSVLSDAVQNTRTVPATDGNWDWEDLRNINFFLEHGLYRINHNYLWLHTAYRLFHCIQICLTQKQ